MNNQSLEATILNRFEEYFAAGLFKDKNAPIVNRYAHAFSCYFEHAEAPAYDGGLLYPSGNVSLWNLNPQAKIHFHYSSSLGGNPNGLLTFADRCANDRERLILSRVVEELSQLQCNPIPNKYRIGGNGFTHSIINYERVLREGLQQYAVRIAACRKNEKDQNKIYFYDAIKETLDAIIMFHGKCVAHLNSLQKTPELQRLIAVLKNVPLQPATSFYEAMVSYNFMWYLDGCDSPGRFDQFMYPYFERDIAAGTLDVKEAKILLEAHWANADACSGWHMILGGIAKNGESGYTELTRLCLETLKNYRRPNAGIRINADMPDHFWDIIFDNWQSGGVNPALYNEKTYLSNIPKHTGVKGCDARDFAFGGCTELMFQGMSNIGSIDGGINLLEILEDALQRLLPQCKSYTVFVSMLKKEIAIQLKIAIDKVNLNQQQMALSRPQLIRSLFVDDCIERGIEYNAGGARYNGGVINVGGLTNTINALLTVKKLFDGELKMSPETLLEMLERDYHGYEKELLQIEKLPKFGNAIAEVDDIAASLSKFIFKEITQYRCWRGNGYFIPGVIMFVTYAAFGEHVGATPDGRRSGAPLVDSIGPMQGTDIKGPTATLLSCTRIPQKMGIGTLVLNLRFGRSIFADKAHREKLKALLKSYFVMDGLQIQVSVADQETLKKAAICPNDYPHLMVKIGGYSEYFRNLSAPLREEVIRRTEQLL
ncbi:MAG: hypothetical protein JXR78_19360 [Victivallales bacterium]|nr:hypothetical protein [Victivallales bacterium]